jgi:PUA domain protein
MSAALRLRHRSRLRRKEVEAVAAQILETFGAETFQPDDPVERAEVGEDRVGLLLGEDILALDLGGRVALTVRGLLRWPASRRWVTVDMGAVPFVYNGADVMAPGIVDADRVIARGDLVWVRDERNKRPLAVGEALLSGAEMAAAEKGKSIKAVHHVGDEYWLHGHEAPEKPAPEPEENP